MRQILFFITITALFFFNQGCKNKKVDLKQYVIGNWELRKINTKQGDKLKSFSPDKVIKLSFSNNKYAEFANGSMISMGRYKILEDQVKSNGVLLTRTAFKSEVYSWDSTRYFLGVERNQLIIVVIDTTGISTKFYERLK